MRATPAISEDALLEFVFAAIGRRKGTAAFDGGMTSDGGVLLLLAAAERRLGIARTLVALIADPRNQHDCPDKAATSGGRVCPSISVM
jgi:hypothetical protein